MKFPEVVSLVKDADKYLKDYSPNVCKNCGGKPDTNVRLFQPPRSFEKIIGLYIICRECDKGGYCNVNTDNIENSQDLLAIIDRGMKEWNDKYGAC